MQVIDKAITPDGIEIELRDLSGEHKLPDYDGMEIYIHTLQQVNMKHLMNLRLAKIT